MHMPAHTFLHMYNTYKHTVYTTHAHTHTLACTYAHTTHACTHMHLHICTHTPRMHACTWMDTRTHHTCTHTHTPEQDLGLDALSKALRRQQEVGLAIQEEVTEHNGEEHTPSSCLGGEENPDT